MEPSKKGDSHFLYCCIYSAIIERGRIKIRDALAKASFCIQITRRRNGQALKQAMGSNENVEDGGGTSSDVTCKHAMCIFQANSASGGPTWAPISANYDATLEEMHGAGGRSTNQTSCNDESNSSLAGLAALYIYYIGPIEHIIIIHPM